MKITKLKIKQILTGKWLDLIVDRMIDKTVLNMHEKEQKKQRNIKNSLIAKKKKEGLLENEKLCPADSKCNHDYIENVEVIGSEPFCDDFGEIGTTYHQKVTYIDGSIKYFDVNTVLSSFPVPDGCQQYEEKKVKRMNFSDEVAIEKRGKNESIEHKF